LAKASDDANQAAQSPSNEKAAQNAESVAKQLNQLADDAALKSGYSLRQQKGSPTNPMTTLAVVNPANHRPIPTELAMLRVTQASMGKNYAGRQAAIGHDCDENSTAEYWTTEKAMCQNNIEELSRNILRNSRASNRAGKNRCVINFVLQCDSS
jgi:hypothetical protein